MGSGERASSMNLEIKEMEVDSAQILEEKARQALDCPCVANLRNGPCGQQFSSAFVCYVKSQEPEKGSDCVASFVKLQDCMLENQNHFIKAPPARDIGTDAEKGSDGQNIEDEDQGTGNQESDDSEGPPTVPPEAIRYPPWYKR